MTKQITLVIDFEKETEKTFYQPNHIRGAVALDALTLGKKLENIEGNPTREDFEEVADFVAGKLYNGQFTREELIDGVHAPYLFETLMNQLRSVFSSGDSGDDENFTKEKVN